MEQEPMEFSCPVNMNSPHNPDAFLSDIDTIPETDDDDVTRQDNEGGSDFIFQQVESLDNLFVEHGRDKPPKFINERYLLGSQLGQGSYGKVKQVLDTFTLQKLAVKIMNKQKLKKIPNGEQNALKYAAMLRFFYQGLAIVLKKYYDGKRLFAHHLKHKSKLFLINFEGLLFE